MKLLIALLLGWAVSAGAAPPTLTLRPVASGLSGPVEIAHAGDSSGRLFVVEQRGVIKIIKDGAVLATPFLDISAQVLSGGERGLLGLAFHPLYRANGKFYVYYTRQTDGTVVVSEFLVNGASADVADAATERQLLTVTHPNANHNGGRLAFGLDGYLYIAIGDGGGSGDPSNNAQNLGVRLGKLLRIDVNVTPNFGVPPGNPFVGQAGKLPEIWAYGLRNPWKFTFDRFTGDLLIADVGEGQREEVDFEPAGDAGGRNYGWHMWEGTSCFSAPCDAAGRVFPIIEYTHANGDRAIVGGYVYRGRKSQALRGYYLYGDNVSNRMWAAAAAGGTWTTSSIINGPSGLSSFGEDEAGELYVASVTNGTVHAIDGPGPAVTPTTRLDFNADGRADILWRNTSTGENYLYPMNGTTILPGEGYARTVADQNWKVAGIGDFDGDGKADVLWRNSSTGENYIYLMNGTAIAGEGYLRAVADQNWRVAGVGDFDGDGKDDILWRNSSTGDNYVYPMDGLAIKASEGYLRAVTDQNWQVAGIGDFDGNGRSDILWRNLSTGENYIYLMNGNTVANEGYIRAVPDQNWQVAGVGDFNGDGKSDILWRNRVTGENYLYPMVGTAILGAEGYLRTVGDTQWQIKGTGDYDGDGKADILWRHATTGENYLYPMAGTMIKPTEGYVRTVPQPDWQIQNPPLAPASPARTLQCAPGATGTQQYDSTMVGCGGRLLKANSATLCSASCHACTSQEYMAHKGAVAPTRHYWTSDALYYYGTGPGSCSASPVNTAGGGPCMLVATGSVGLSRVDPDGNTVNWNHCAYGTSGQGADAFFGGCAVQNTAGSLCCCP